MAQSKDTRPPGDTAEPDPAVRYGELADRLGDLVSAHDPDGTYRYVSAAATELLGYQPHELVGGWWYDMVHPDDRDRVTAAHRNVLNGMASTVSYRIQRRTGGYRWVETMSRAVFADGDHGPVTEIVCSTRPLEGRGVIAHVAGSEEQTRLQRVQRILAEEDIAPTYQPIFELGTGRIVAYEGLARFPDHEERPPSRWFADAWQVGLGAPLELLAIRAICGELPRIPDDVRLSVNASPPTLSSPAFLECLGPEAHRVTVELTEHLDIDDYDDLSGALMRLHTAGVKTAIDDFGAGFASLRHLLRVGPDWIKLDISLTERISENPVAHSLAVSLLSFAESVGVQVVAEGIETAEELDAIAEVGIPLGQGFHLGMPGPLEQSLAVQTA
jgi:PAS domain S-box-containing protein